MHEIVTLQFGKQSNYVGTHFWNAQESYFTYSTQEESLVDHDVHFRPGVAPDGSDTFTPRCLIYDFKDEFGTLKKVNELYEVLDEQDSTGHAWGGATTMQRQPQILENEYQRRLNAGVDPPALTKDSVRFWSDFNRVFYHPKSVVQIYETDLGPSDRAFENRQSGEDLFWTLDKEQDLFDRDVRPFVEECDQIQGFSVLSSVENGWGGFSARYLDRLNDEFGKLSVWTWGLGETEKAKKVLSQLSNKRKNAQSLVNEALALLEMSPHSSTYIPVATSTTQASPLSSLDSSSRWMTSAVQTMAIESIMLPCRLKRIAHQRVASMDELSNLLKGEGDKNIARLGFCAFSQSSSQWQTSNECDLFPSFDGVSSDFRARTFSRVDVKRGMVKDQTSLEDDENSPEMHSFHTSLAFPLQDSFPRDYVSTASHADSVPIEARLSTTSAVASWAKFLERTTRLRLSIGEREEFSNGLQEIGEKYDASWSSDGSDWED